MGIALFEVIHRIFDHLVERQLMTDDDVTALFAKAAKVQSLVGRPANEEAAELLGRMAKGEGRQMATGSCGLF
jgi:hypothetical protein